VHKRAFFASQAYDPTIFSPNRGVEDPNACIASIVTYNNFWGPWLPHPGPAEGLPWVASPPADVPTISYLDSFWHAVAEPAPAPEAGAADESAHTEGDDTGLGVLGVVVILLAVVACGVVGMKACGRKKAVAGDGIYAKATISDN
jgi:hypothetical protein